jgi:hypothetical protein
MARPQKPGRGNDGRTEREERVEQVVDLMSRGQWLAGVSDKALAKQWRCTADNARKISAEASRLIRARLRDDPAAKAEARAMLLQNFEVIRAKAMAKGDAPSLRVALDAMRAYGFYLGIEPAKRLDVTERADPFEGWTTDEKLAFSRDGRRPRRALARVATEGLGAVEHGGEPRH